MKQTPLKRKAPLAVDPSKVREFLRRARENSDLSRGQPLKPSPPKQRKPQPADVLSAIEKRSKGKCIVCGANCDVRRDRHHVLAVERWPQLELVADNQVLACTQCHMQHETPGCRPEHRIPYSALPECAIRLAHTTSGAAVLELERRYPR